jgi:hypothetical protein
MNLMLGGLCSMTVQRDGSSVKPWVHRHLYRLDCTAVGWYLYCQRASSNVRQIFFRLLPNISVGFVDSLTLAETIRLPPVHI